MATSIAKVYADTVKKNQRVLYGVWEPGFPVKLGDYGIMNGNIFVQIGNISELHDLKSLTIKTRKDDTKDEKFFTSQHGVEFTLNPKGSGVINGVETNASIDISFSKENSIFFNAAECAYEMIENKYELGRRLLDIHRKSKETWRREFVVVTDLVVSKRALILISTASDYAISFEADAKTPIIDLAKASIGLTLKSQKSSGYKVVTEEGLIPLVGLSKIQPSFLWFGGNFKPLSFKYSPQMLDTIKNSEMIKTESSEEELHFFQYTDDLEE